MQNYGVDPIPFRLESRKQWSYVGDLCKVPKMASHWPVPFGLMKTKDCDLNSPSQQLQQMRWKVYGCLGADILCRFEFNSYFALE